MGQAPEHLTLAKSNSTDLSMTPRFLAWYEKSEWVTEICGPNPQIQIWETPSDPQISWPSSDSPLFFQLEIWGGQDFIWNGGKMFFEN